MLSTRAQSATNTTGIALSNVNNTLATVYYNQDGSVNSVRVGGSRASRNNNPGNMRYDSIAINNGAIGQDINRFAIFPNEEAGERAREQLLRNGSYSSGREFKPYGEETVRSMLEHYAPSTDSNNPTKYANFLRDEFGVDVDVKKIKDFTPAEFQQLLKGMRKKEGNIPSTELTAKEADPDGNGIFDLYQPEPVQEQPSECTPSDTDGDGVPDAIQYPSPYNERRPTPWDLDANGIPDAIQYPSPYNQRKQPTPWDLDGNGIPDSIQRDPIPEWQRELNRVLNFFRRDPLTLDLDDNNQLETLAENGSQGVMFDHDGDGIRTPTGWIGTNDGFYVNHPQKVLMRADRVVRL